MTEAVEEPGTSEQAADLAALQSAVAGAEPAPGTVAVQQEQQGPQPPSMAALQMAGMLVGMLRPLASFAVPALRDAPDELWEPIPEGVAAVMDHYGAAPEWMQSPWARLGMALAPLAGFAVLETMKAKPKKEPERAALSAPESAAVVSGGSPGPGVTFGAPVAAVA